MINPNPSKCLGKVQWKLAKQMANSDFYSVCHNSIITVNLFEILKILAGIC